MDKELEDKKQAPLAHSTMPDLKGSPKPVTSVYSPAINSAKPQQGGPPLTTQAAISSVTLVAAEIENDAKDLNAAVHMSDLAKAIKTAKDIYQRAAIRPAECTRVGADLAAAGQSAKGGGLLYQALQSLEGAGFHWAGECTKATSTFASLLPTVPDQEKPHFDGLAVTDAITHLFKTVEADTKGARGKVPTLSVVSAQSQAMQANLAAAIEQANLVINSPASVANYHSAVAFTNEAYETLSAIQVRGPYVAQIRQLKKLAEKADHVSTLKTNTLTITAGRLAQLAGV